MRIAMDELLHHDVEPAHVRVTWNKMEADAVGAVLTAVGIDYTQEHASGGWVIATSTADAARAHAALERSGLDSIEAAHNAGL